MKKLVFIFAGLTLVPGLIASAKEIENSLIEKIRSQRPDKKVSQLSKWRYKGKIVYYAGPQCCDIPAELFDQNGEKICTVGGGISNRIDKECADFNDKGAKKSLGIVNFKESK